MAGVAAATRPAAPKPQPGPEAEGQAGPRAAGSDLVFIVGRQRSGTTVFRNLLVRAGAMNADEIFHGDLAPRHRFYAFLRDRIAEDPRFVHPQTHPTVFRQFIAALRAEAAGRVIALDVKYFGLNLIPAREDVDARAPFLMRFMREEGAHVVHIIRRNKLRVHVSEQISIATGRWSAEKDHQLVAEKPRLDLDPDEVLAVIERLERQDRRVAQMLAAGPGAVPLTYEEMFTPEGMFAAPVAELGQRIMAPAPVDPRPGNLKMNPEPLSALIGNFDVVARALRGGPHEWMLDGPG
ncbi:hypothetical protein [Pseudooceanicola sp. 200-1SW]|uniref:hypothetical protein n=1 Tax=Pseudooceanicola sp. 200-1SW TaxID=3425949 RepID=UPI003D7F86F1